VKEAHDAMRSEQTALPQSEVYGPYIDSPVWPWSLAGWCLAALYVVLALAAWLSS
jgi:hypothetical protein